MIKSNRFFLTVFLHWQVKFQRASGILDEKLRIDIVCVKETSREIICGIQIKPQTFRSHTSEMGYHYKCFEKWGHPATFMFYDERGRFPEMEVSKACLFISENL